jgi:diadenylate cyclase
MLETAGASRFPKLILNREETDQNKIEMGIVQTLNACNTLSLQKIGALIVFERKVFLNDAIKTGTVLDAQVSSMLLKNLFFPNAALHDGATIIRDGRIIPPAACSRSQTTYTSAATSA